MRTFSILKKLLGPKLTKQIRPFGHGLKTYLAAIRYGFPARKLTVIGITGTKGKTTTTAFLGRLANLSGIKTGYISTAVINVKGFEVQNSAQEVESQEFLNPYKMTSIDGFAMQKYLRQMVINGCKWVVLEMSSQGLEQHRHWGLGGFDETLFLNIFPEHLEAHGGWENYLLCKAKLFQNLKAGGIFVANGSDEQSEFMWKHIPANKRNHIQKLLISKNQDYKIQEEPNSKFLDLLINEKIYPTQMTADFEIENLAFAITALQAQAQKENLKIELDQKIPKLLWNVPGRMEWIVENGQLTNRTNLTILVDYAHEPESMKQLLSTLKKWKDHGFYTQVIHILSCDGVGRDDWKKPVMGKISFDLADISILTTDNYEIGDVPADIVDLLAKDLPKQSLESKYFKREDRREAFRKALHLANELLKSNPFNVLIVSTGVGSEQGLTRPGGKLDWDERKIWREEFAKLNLN